MNRIVALLLVLAACSPARASVQETMADGAPPFEDTAPADATLPPVVQPTAPVGTDDVAAVHSDGSITTVRDGIASTTEPGAVDLLALDGRTAIDVARAAEDATEVSWLDVITGTTVARTTIAGADLVPTATGIDARHVALVSPPGGDADGTIAPGRSSTTIVLADRERGEVYRTTLDGNLVPEGFGNDAGAGHVPGSVFVLEYLPPQAPTHYRVRVLRTESGTLDLPFNLRDKSVEVDAAMAGISRTHVVSHHDEGLLFTLYRGVDGEAGRHGYAFVHTLGFGGGVWCLDIAPELALDHEPGALVVAGDRLVVASANGTVGSYDIEVVLDSDREPVMDVVRQYIKNRHVAPVMAATNDRVWVGWHTWVYELDAQTLDMVTVVPMQFEQPVTAMAATDDGLLVAHPGGIVMTTAGRWADITPHRDDSTEPDIVTIVSG